MGETQSLERPGTKRRRKDVLSTEETESELKAVKTTINSLPSSLANAYGGLLSLKDLASFATASKRMNRLLGSEIERRKPITLAAYSGWQYEIDPKLRPKKTGRLIFRNYTWIETNNILPSFPNVESVDLSINRQNGQQFSYESIKLPKSLLDMKRLKRLKLKFLCVSLPCGLTSMNSRLGLGR